MRKTGRRTYKGIGRRTPRGYDGIHTTSHRLGEVLPLVLKRIGRSYESRGDLIIMAWPEVIGEKLAAMTKAVEFEDGKLFVKVKNSTLYSLLNREYKSRLLKSLRDKFPGTNIKTIIFRIN
ncbi:MAG: DUF721 domain-containing protein [Waddliaceae bacterium]|jgi:hypothetical protein|nr:DUF721 domain-containing protein [Waddliaceae bacterium]MBT3578396.1 DUF721 domain-containing protein [Waddliaceae bacterium]MBT4445282.1 DUF721 domain-containing protein [Waddliaceae bacterium]MBT6928553.1 DUF721 domain-containing protein [Waddliaceae bacterium]MBT7264271.1 DUF721 domain-containing protein [Waddliaceae bacterium]